MGVANKMIKFKYDVNQSYQDNFEYWFQENSTEKRRYLEKPYTRDEAITVFRSMYGKWEQVKANSTGFGLIA